MRTLRVLSRLLAYPDEELLSQTSALKDVVVEDGFLKAKTVKKLNKFIDDLGGSDLLDAQETYVELFDRGRAHCLHLFEHVHGESRLRGQAMLDLSERYAEKGLHVGVGELPDYLPVFLEFISICEPEEGLETLAQAAPVIATIGEKLRRKKSGYATVFGAIVELSGAKLSQKDIDKAADASLPNIKTLDELDEQWQEPDAFGKFANATDCGSCDPMPLQPAQKDEQQGVTS
ncbi:MAG TPA: nitrate reductase molybdenum cofactor assembly chaperone [Hellea balneolensis]|uniref:Nitrate reductase molybdenum cofactor assembly chaperone n=1 Tax=Hellea balneolensis TaxID=287478 RepID=A0A7C3FZ99_9PROT|nr:nitrate reductase molybdenum cofactor assembly chaperone [Hellea balneolensis]